MTAHNYLDTVWADQFLGEISADEANAKQKQSFPMTMSVQRNSVHNARGPLLERSYNRSLMLGCKAMKIVSAVAPLPALLCMGEIAAEADVQLHDLPKAEAGDIYSVYSALIKATVGTGNSSKVLISDNTINGTGRPGCLKAPADEESADYQEQIKNFAERNRVHYKLLAKFAVGRPYELVRTPPALPSGRSAAHFLFSGVGFNAARDRAVVYMEYGGGGGVQFLTKVKGVWTVDQQRMPHVCGWIG